MNSISDLLIKHKSDYYLNKIDNILLETAGFKCTLIIVIYIKFVSKRQWRDKKTLAIVDIQGLCAPAVRSVPRFLMGVVFFLDLAFFKGIMFFIIYAYKSFRSALAISMKS